MPTDRREVTVWGTPFSPWTLMQTVDEVDRLIAEGEPCYFVTANLHTLKVADSDPQMRAALDDAAFVLADGMPIVWAARLRGRRLPERVAGSDLLPALCERAAQKSYRVFFLGGPPGVGERATTRLVERFPGLQVVGTESPPFGEPTAADETELLGRIQAARPDLVVIAFSQPRGDVWARRHLAQTGAKVCVNLGASLDFAAGRVSRAPRWVQRTGMEWLYRISREPRRLTLRYAADGWFLLRMLSSDWVSRLRRR